MMRRLVKIGTIYLDPDKIVSAEESIEIHTNGNHREERRIMYIRLQQGDYVKIEHSYIENAKALLDSMVIQEEQS